MEKKKVLVVGEGSYIGTSFINASKDKYDIKALDSMKPITVDMLKGYDSIIHVAGIAHVSSKKSMAPLYFKVNRDLAIDTAKKAKEAGVKQFIFMSSMIIYGKDHHIWKPYIITKDTKPNPENAYGQSKLEADLAIQAMNCDSFHTVVIRTPMVYGPGCKGNYPRLESLALKLPFIPNIRNERSVIEIKNLVSAFQEYIDGNSSGVMYPQDPKPMCTSDVMAEARIRHGKKSRRTKAFNWLVMFSHCQCLNLTRCSRLKSMIFMTRRYDLSLPFAVC